MWFQWINVSLSLVLAGSAAWSVWNARQISKRKNPAPYGQLRILWIVEHLLSDLERVDYHNATLNMKDLHRHFFNSADPNNQKGTNPEGGDWYFVWEMERAYSEFIEVTCEQRVIGVFKKGLNRSQAIDKAKKMLEVQRDLVEKIQQG